MEHIASRLFHTSWKKIKTTEQYSGFNPVVERSYAKVLCLTCCAINEEDFIFCKKCGSHNASPRPHTPDSAQNPNPNKTLSQTHRLLGTTSIINTQEDNITKEKTKFFQYITTKTSTQKSKKILKDFEIFAHSRGLHKYTTLPVQPTFSILEAQDKDILDYLIFKNITSGKTWVHDTNCPSLGLRQKTQSCTTHNCSFNHAAQSMRTGVLHMLKKGFQDIGLSGPWNVASKMGNPVESLLVTEYLTMIKQQQAKAGVTQKQAAILLRDETHRLIQSMISKLYKPNISLKETFDLLRDLALITLAFATGKRGDDLQNLLVTQIVNFPNFGLLFGFQFGKCLRDGSTNTFGIQPDSQYPIMCPVRRINKFMQFCKLHHIDMSGNHLFSNVLEDKQHRLTKTMAKLTSEQMNTRLRNHMSAAGMKLSQGDLTYSMHSFRSGGPTSLLLEGKSLHSVMTSAYWKNPKMAMHYVKLLEVLGPFNYDQQTITPADYQRLNNIPLEQRNNKWKAFPKEWFTS